MKRQYPVQDRGLPQTATREIQRELVEFFQEQSRGISLPLPQGLEEMVITCTHCHRPSTFQGELHLPLHCHHFKCGKKLPTPLLLSPEEEMVIEILLMGLTKKHI